MHASKKDSRYPETTASLLGPNTDGVWDIVFHKRKKENEDPPDEELVKFFRFKVPHICRLAAASLTKPNVYDALTPCPPCSFLYRPSASLMRVDRLSPATVHALQSDTIALQNYRTGILKLLSALNLYNVPDHAGAWRKHVRMNPQERHSAARVFFRIFLSTLLVDQSNSHQAVRSVVPGVQFFVDVFSPGDTCFTDLFVLSDAYYEKFKAASHQLKTQDQELVQDSISVGPFSEQGSDVEESPHDESDHENDISNPESVSVREQDQPGQQRSESYLQDTDQRDSTRNNSQSAPQIAAAQVPRASLLPQESDEYIQRELQTMRTPTSPKQEQERKEEEQDVQVRSWTQEEEEGEQETKPEEKYNDQRQSDQQEDQDKDENQESLVQSIEDVKATESPQKQDENPIIQPNDVFSDVESILLQTKV